MRESGYSVGHFWPPVADWDKAVIAKDGLVIRPLLGLSQHLVSGALDRFSSLAGLEGDGVGALGLASTERYALWLARDRMLAVGLDGDLAGGGWHAAGFAVTDVSAGFRVFEIEGADTRGLIAEATTIDPANPGPSAAIGFAGFPAILYAHGTIDRLRLHVDRGHGMALWSWLEDWAASRKPAP